MRYHKFIIENYRAIVGPLEIDVLKNSLVPIIGVNECGKTTILQAIFSFDYFNDTLNENGRHLRDTTNLYRTSSPAATVSALVEISEEEFGEVLDDVEQVAGVVPADVRAYRRKRKEIVAPLMIQRDLRTGRYDLLLPTFDKPALNHEVAQAIVGSMPYILYFDDFRDSVEERVEIRKGEDGKVSGWLSILEQLFKRTDKSYSVFDLEKTEERRRKSMLAAVKRKLNGTLTREWQNFRLDDSDALQISIDYQEEGSPEAKRAFLKLEIIETDSNGYEHYFFIRDRSKGFFWFFNFVMKLEFNPKVLTDDDDGTIYLLDEPGSYLHASAQSKLCQKLKQLSRRNRVLYCTHSHYLLDPEVIPLASIKVAEKSGTGNVQLIPIHEHPGSVLERRSAFQPVIDALEIKPFLLDLSHQHVVITEGIVDYYAFEMLKQGRNINVLPSVGADSVTYYASLMIAWRIQYRALWDNDEQGRAAFEEACRLFGEEESAGHFFLLPAGTGRRKDRILQDLFEPTDIAMIKRDLGLPKNSAFHKVIASLFYSSERHEIVNRLSDQTKRNFALVYDRLGLE